MVFYVDLWALLAGLFQTFAPTINFAHKSVCIEVLALNLKHLNSKHRQFHFEHIFQAETADVYAQNALKVELSGF